MKWTIIAQMKTSLADFNDPPGPHVARFCLVDGRMHGRSDLRSFVGTDGHHVWKKLMTTYSAGARWVNIYDMPYRTFVFMIYSTIRVLMVTAIE